MRKVTVTTNKVKYNIRLKAEPDYKILGTKLKVDFKKIMESKVISNLTNEELLNFQQTGEITVGGHVLVEGDLKLVYTFDTSGGDATAQYEAHGEGDVSIHKCEKCLGVTVQ